MENENKFNWKNLGLKLLFPHISVLILLTPISVAFLVLSLIYFDSTNILAIVSYLLSFYVLLAICFRMPKIIKFFKELKRNNKYLSKYFSDVNIRINISLYGSLIWNTAFAIFQLFLGFSQNSLWFYSMFAYYVILAVMRFFLVRHTRTYKPAEERDIELKRYRFCGWLLLVMNLALSVIITIVSLGGKEIKYHMITTIAIAAYTFFTFTFAIINIVRYKKYNSPVYSAAKMISLIAASVSMFTLETAMLTVFGGAETESFSKWMLPLTGAVVMVFAITIAIYMIVNSFKQLKKITPNN
jgi:hypothetical protein